MSQPPRLAQNSYQEAKLANCSAIPFAGKKKKKQGVCSASEYHAGGRKGLPHPGGMFQEGMKYHSGQDGVGSRGRGDPFKPPVPKSRPKLGKNTLSK